MRWVIVNTAKVAIVLTRHRRRHSCFSASSRENIAANRDEETIIQSCEEAQPDLWANWSLIGRIQAVLEGGVCVRNVLGLGGDRLLCHVWQLLFSVVKSDSRPYFSSQMVFYNPSAQDSCSLQLLSFRQDASLYGNYLLLHTMISRSET